MLASLRSTAVAPRRPALPSLGDSERDRRSRSQPRPRCPGSAASRSTFLPTSWSAPREPAPESSLLGRSRPRASARRPSRRSMCGRACTPRTRAAARALTGAGSRLAAWPARPFKFLSHSAAAKRAQSADWHVARGRSASPRRRSWPPARAQRPRHSRSASRRRSASERANSHCAEIHARTEIAPRNDVRPRTADYENETYAWRRNRSQKTCAQFCCGGCASDPLRHAILGR